MVVAGAGNGERGLTPHGDRDESGLLGGDLLWVSIITRVKLSAAVSVRTQQSAHLISMMLLFVSYPLVNLALKNKCTPWLLWLSGLSASL